MQNLTRITRNPEVMGGKPCIRGMRVTVGTRLRHGLLQNYENPRFVGVKQKLNGVNINYSHHWI